MHREANQFIVSVKNQSPEFFTGKKVLEVGSLDINGSVRQFFTDCVYHGIDLGEGPGVDAVMHVLQVNPPVPTYDVIISTEALEHDKQWALSLEHMHDLLKPGGLLLITCAAPNRWEHGTTRTDGGYGSPFTTDYYRNISVEDFASVLPPDLFAKSYLGYRGDMEDLYFVGVKQGEPKPDHWLCVDSACPYNVVWPDHRLAVCEAWQEEQRQKSAPVKTGTVTVEISTLNRYFTTLPMTIASVATQTRKPDRLVLYDDGEQNELRDVTPYRDLFHLLEQVGIEFETFKTPRLGLAANHQDALERAKTDFILRLDDDCILEPNTIEVLMNAMEDEMVGAVAPLVHNPTNLQPLPQGVEGKVDDVFNNVNLQWYDWNGGARETEHLYSAYLYRVKAGREAGGYPKLSPVSFREDSWFSMKLKRAGYRLIVTPFTKVWHLQQQTGGIRTFTDGSLWAQDDALFREWLASCGVEDSSPKLIVLDCGIGDHFLVKSVLPKLKEIHKDRGLVIAISHVGILEDEGVPLISITEAQQRLGARFTESNLYQWCWKHEWTGSLEQAMLECWK